MIQVNLSLCGPQSRRIEHLSHRGGPSTRVRRTGGHRGWFPVGSSGGGAQFGEHGGGAGRDALPRGAAEPGLWRLAGLVPRLGPVPPLDFLAEFLVAAGHPGVVDVVAVAVDHFEDGVGQ